MKSENNIKEKVFVGMSGGVDSSVSAYLLKKAGYEVVGVFIKTWQPDWLPCTWKEERKDAMRASAHLNIPFLTLDLTDVYKKDVADYMITEYRNGRTPNPDVMCNKYVKFGAFLEFALKNGAKYIATGHYARNILEHDGDNKIYSLYTGIDKEKDQSYFLWTLTQNELRHIIFPVGAYRKSEIRKIASKIGLPNAEKKDSQGICFLGEVNMKEFLSHYIEPKKGNVLNVEGGIIGYHFGAYQFTRGERHGFTILNKGSSDKPMFVIDRDLDKNTITVSEKMLDGSLPNAVSIVTLDSCSWVYKAPESANNLKNCYQVRTRYRQKLEEVKINKIDTENNKIELSFKNSQNSISIGQSAVIYDGEKCIGGGIIKS